MIVYYTLADGTKGYMQVGRDYSENGACIAVARQLGADGEVGYSIRAVRLA